MSGFYPDGLTQAEFDQAHNEYDNPHEVEAHDCEYREEYYGYRCAICEAFFPYGNAPWDESPDEDEPPARTPYDPWEND